MVNRESGLREKDSELSVAVSQVVQYGVSDVRTASLSNFSSIRLQSKSRRFAERGPLAQ
jgi:hypothetical protein